MRTTARLSVLIGAGLLAGAVGAGPAQAAGSHVPAPPSHGMPRDVVGYLKTKADCEWIGQVGDQMHRWDNPHCDAGDGALRGWWKLTVERRNIIITIIPGGHRPH